MGEKGEGSGGKGGGNWEWGTPTPPLSTPSPLHDPVTNTDQSTFTMGRAHYSQLIFIKIAI